MLDEKTKEKLRKRLEEQRQDLLNELDQEDREFKEMTADEVNENTYSNHIDDAGSHLEEQNRITAIEDNARKLLDQVEKALKRMEEGTYGISEFSGKEIPVERLEAVPFATRLVDEEDSSRDNSMYTLKDN